MPQGLLSAANVVQAKTGGVDAAIAPVSLDAGAQAGSTVIVELHADGVPFTDGGFGGRVPDGFGFDGGAIPGAGVYPFMYIFRKPGVAAGEGVAGSTSWDFSYLVTTGWNWRVTEWDTGLEPVSPLDAIAYNSASGTAPTALSTGTTTENGRPDTVCLAWHHWHRPSNTAESMTFSDHTNGFTVRDSLRRAFGTTELYECWSWKFATAVAQHECTATINLATRNSQDVYIAMLAVYAATTYA